MLEIPPNLNLADPEFHKSNNIDLLIGTSLFWNLLSTGQIKLSKGGPILQKTIFGWILSGHIPNYKPPNTPNTLHCHISTTLDIQGQIAKFWEMEEPAHLNTLSSEQNYCETHFSETTTRDPTGRFVVSIPLKESPEILGDSREIATQRFLSLEMKLSKNINLKNQYIKLSKPRSYVSS